MAWLNELSVGLGRVVASKIAGASNAILYSLRFLEDPTDEDVGESSTEEPAYGPIGWYARPMPPVAAASATPNNPKGECEVLAAKLDDRAYAHAFRDLRINAKVNPKDGEVGVAHYLGGFLSMKVNDTGDGTDVVIYSPHQDASGTPDKAHALSMNSSTAQSHISLMHSYGQSITLNKDGSVVLLNKDGDAMVEVKDGAVTITGAKIVLAGGAILGDSNPASCDAVMLSTDLLTWIGQANTLFAALVAAIGNPIPTITAPTAAPAAATLVKAK